MEMEGLESKAKASGACRLVVKDLKEEFVRDYIFPCLRVGAVYERKYLLQTSLAQPIIAKAMVDVAKVGADAVSHGCTGKGNEQSSMLLLHGSGRSLDEKMPLRMLRNMVSLFVFLRNLYADTGICVTLAIRET